MTFDLGALLVACVLGIVWLVRLEGRVNVHDTIFAEREKLFGSSLYAIIERLERIEAKIDKGTNGK